MPGVNVPRARRWFWTLLMVAVLATGAAYWAVNAPPGPLAGTVLLGGGLLAATATLQATRVLTALNGPPDLRRSAERLTPRLRPNRQRSPQPSRRRVPAGQDVRRPRSEAGTWPSFL